VSSNHLDLPMMWNSRLVFLSPTMYAALTHRSKMLKDNMGAIGKPMRSTIKRHF